MDNADLSAAIRELTRELSELRRAVERLSSQPEAVPAVLSESQSSRAHVKNEAKASVATAPPNTELATIRGLLGKMFRAALDPDEELAFESFVECMHSDRIDAPRSIPSLREFNWKSIRRNVRRYLVQPDDADSFVVERSQPAEPNTETRSVKIFISCEGRSPVPVTFKRDTAAEDVLRVTDSSL